MMLDASVGSITWLTCLISVSVGGVLVGFPYLTPRAFSNLFLFGKTRKSKAWNFGSQGFFLLPKRWFHHFYAVGMVSTVFWVFTLYLQHNNDKLPFPAEVLLQVIRYPQTEGTADLVACYIVLTCIGIQVTRRFLECVTISIYSKDGTMSIVIYIVGLGFYFGLPLTCLAGSNLSQELKFSDIFSQIGVIQMCGIAVFVYGSWLQNQTARIFAALRCNKKGDVMNDKHHIPRGGMFEYVSSPHYLAEILIYTSVCTIFAFRNTMFNCLWLFVVANQFISAYYSHRWYKEKFPKYPKKRKAIFPFIY